MDSENMDSPNKIMFNKRTNMSIPSINIINHTRVNKYKYVGMLKERDMIRLQPIQR